MEKKFIYKNIDVLNNILQVLEMGAFAGQEDKIKEVLAEYTIIKQREAADKNYDETDLMILIKQVLERKEMYEFDDEIKKIMENLIQALIKNYDKHIITDKIPKETYIREIIRIIEENIEAAEFVELEENLEFGDIKDLIGEEESSREKLNKLDARGLAERFNRKILIGSSGNKLGTTLHEIKHMSGDFMGYSSSMYDMVISKVFEEGYATFNKELSSDPMMNDEAAIRDFFEGTKVTMGMSFRSSLEYQQYKNIVDKLIYLIGMKKFEEIRYMDREFLENIKKELESKFGNDKSEQFINALCQVSNIINPEGIKELDKLKGKKDIKLKKPSISRIEAAIKKIDEFTIKINSPEELRIELEKEKERQLLLRDKIMKGLTGFFSCALPKNVFEENEERIAAINSMKEDDVKRDWERRREVYQKELFKLLDVYSRSVLTEKEHTQKPEINNFIFSSIEQQLKNDDKIHPFQMIEEVTNDCFEIMIENENTEKGLLELYNQIRIYNKNCRFGVIDNKTGMDITKKDFDKRIYGKLMGKMKGRNLIPEYLGDKQKNELIEEIVFNSSCYNLQDATIQIKEDNKGCAILINGQGKSFNAEVQNWEDKKYTMDTNTQAAMRKIMEDMYGRKNKFRGCKKRKILMTREGKGGKDHVYR